MAPSYFDPPLTLHMSHSSPLDKSGNTSSNNDCFMLASPPSASIRKRKRISLKKLFAHDNTRPSREQLMEAHRVQMNKGFFLQKATPKNINYSTNSASILDSIVLMNKNPSDTLKPKEELNTEQHPDIMATSAEFDGCHSSHSSEIHYDLMTVSGGSPDRLASKDLKPRIIFY